MDDLTLADEFLADMDDFSDEDDVKNEAPDDNDNEELSEESLAKKLAKEELARQFGKQEETDEKMTYDNVHEFIKVFKSDSFVEHMAQVEKYSKQAADGVVAPQSMSEDDPEYAVIVSSNQVIVDIDAEIDLVYRFVRDLYAEKFPELESLVLHAMDYIRVVKAIGNELDLTQIDLTDLLPANTIMVVSVTATTSSGKALDPGALKRVMEACDIALELEAAKHRILVAPQACAPLALTTPQSYVESRMTSVAPNLSALVGTNVAAKLMAAAGGLAALSKLPACTVLILGTKKKVLAGMSTATAMSRVGFVAESNMMLKTPPDLRTRAGRVLSGKCTLAARVDAYQQDPSGAVGQRFFDEIDAKISKWQEAPPGKKEKALTAPDTTKKTRRAGKRVRKLKETMAMSEMRKQANRVEFGKMTDDTFRNEEISLGMLSGGATGGRIRNQLNERSGKINVRKVKQQQQNSAGVSGLASSLAFTPVQGLELENPQAASEREAKRENTGYFAADSGFSFKVPEPVKKKARKTEPEVKKEPKKE